MLNIPLIAEIFDVRLKLFAVGSSMAMANWPLGDVFDMAGKAGTLSMQGLMLACIFLLGGAIVWQNKAREALNKERHEENQQIQRELSSRLMAQQASIDAERVARIGKMMEQQKEDIEARKDLAVSLRDIAAAIQSNNQVIGELARRA